MFSPSHSDRTVFHQRQHFLLILILVVTSFFEIRSIAVAEITREYQVKAAFLYHFAQFVEWPSTTFSDTKDSLKICILGTDPFGPHLDKTLKGKNLNNHPFWVQREVSDTEMKSCHILFMGSLESKQMQDIHKNLMGTHVLTIGESDRFLEHGGMINFYLQNNKVRFEINSAAAKQAKLKISSKLLRLAKVVSPKD